MSSSSLHLALVALAIPAIVSVFAMYNINVGSRDNIDEKQSKNRHDYGNY